VVINLSNSSDNGGMIKTINPKKKVIKPAIAPVPSEASIFWVL
jgi:hypothetical protein